MICVPCGIAHVADVSDLVLDHDLAAAGAIVPIHRVQTVTVVLHVDVTDLADAFRARLGLCPRAALVTLATGFGFVFAFAFTFAFAMLLSLFILPVFQPA